MTLKKFPPKVITGYILSNFSKKELACGLNFEASYKTP